MLRIDGERKRQGRLRLRVARGQSPRRLPTVDNHALIALFKTRLCSY